MLAERTVPNNVVLLATCIMFAARGEGRNAPVAVTNLATAFRELGHYVTVRLIARGCMAFKKYATIGQAARRSEDYLEQMLSLVARYPGLPKRVQKKAKLPFPRYLQILRRTTWQLLADFPLQQRGGLNPHILAAAIVYAADRVLAKEWDTAGVLKQEIMCAATGVAEYSIRDHFVSVLKSRFISNPEDLEQEGALEVLREEA